MVGNEKLVKVWNCCWPILIVFLITFALLIVQRLITTKWLCVTLLERHESAINITGDKKKSSRSWKMNFRCGNEWKKKFSRDFNRDILKKRTLWSHNGKNEGCYKFSDTNARTRHASSLVTHRENEKTLPLEGSFVFYYHDSCHEHWSVKKETLYTEDMASNQWRSYKTPKKHTVIIVFW